MLIIANEDILTDGSVYISASGDEIRKFNRKDRIGIRRLREQGIECVLIISEDDPILLTAAERIGIDKVHYGNKQEILLRMAEDYRTEELACILSDTDDLDLLEYVELGFTVKGAESSLNDKLDYVTKTGGGEGVILEIAELLTRS